ncbi:OLC1v1032993C1 [Oldenlandia corymbosa var. corymbosa]|uniref:OLC1v1032993C1 n=1 Tax=Oldenlandia corymbosa var. corymbosa TaxID=529605 RepID=A0AAV1CP33_OLDCO|nr:OLC1v1032993C1 [Oldenlandia corymbosa var. corymbosa]
MELVHYEDNNSQYLCIGTVDKKSSSPNPRLSLISEDGMNLQGNTSQFWDLALSVQAIISSTLAEDYGVTLARAHDFLKQTQVQENPSGDFVKMYRHASKGSWTLSTAVHKWQVSDCTAEGLKAALLLSQISSTINVGKELDEANLNDDVNVFISLHSSNGGFPAWEPARHLVG